MATAFKGLNLLWCIQNKKYPKIAIF